MPHINDIIWYLSFLWLSNIPLLEKEVTTTPVFLPREFYGQGSLAGCCPWDGEESNMTEWLTLTYNIPSHTHTHTHTHKAHLYHSSVDGHLGFSIFWLLWTVLLWTLGCMYLFRFEFLFLLGRCPGVGSLDDMVTLSFVFWGTSMLFFIVVVPVFIPTNSVGVFPFLHTLTSIYCL